MPSVARLGSRDVDSALAFVTEAAAVDGDQPFELPIIERLLELIPGNRAGYFEYVWGGADLYKVEHPVLDFDWTADVVGACLHVWPLCDMRWFGATTAVRFSDCLSPARRGRNAWYVEVMRPGGVEHELKVWLPAPDGVVRGFWVHRGPASRDFDERDRDILTILRPHLGVVRERWERRHRPPGLTDREVEVLSLIREGLTNQEIADRLVIASGTVRTHLENIFEKLGVHTRTAALARVRRDIVRDPRDVNRPTLGRSPILRVGLPLTPCGSQILDPSDNRRLDDRRCCQN